MRSIHVDHKETRFVCILLWSQVLDSTYNPVIRHSFFVVKKKLFNSHVLIILPIVNKVEIKLKKWKCLYCSGAILASVTMCRVKTTILDYFVTKVMVQPNASININALKTYFLFSPDYHTKHTQKCVITIDT